MKNYTQEQLGEILDNAKTLDAKCVNMTNSYYVGGTFVVDTKVNGETGLIFFNLDEFVSNGITGESNLMSIDNVRKTFAIYKEHKGENAYYKKQVQTSVMRHFVS